MPVKIFSHSRNDKQFGIISSLYDYAVSDY